MPTVLITGIDKGIGKALTEKFLKDGYLVIGTFLVSAPFEDKNLSVFPLDLASADSIAKCANAISESGKRIDILINNAGVLIDEDKTRVEVEDLRKTLEINLIGTINFTEHIIPLINKGGHIVSISSRAGSLAMAGDGPSASHLPYHYPSYKISKAGLNMYTRTLAIQMKDSNITVSSVHPGWVRTHIGGEEAEMSPEEAAEGIYKIAISRPETGQFWFQDKQLPW